jgi:hypothetical protein
MIVDMSGGMDTIRPIIAASAPSLRAKTTVNGPIKPEATEDSKFVA